jgi:hypothetical protein
MRTNEAPEKIFVYIPDDDLVGTASTQKGFPHQFVTEEYTRTDAFIDKACEWLEKELPVTDLSSSNMLKITFKVFDKENKKVFIENFKKYMKE